MTTVDRIVLWLLIAAVPAVNLYPIFYAFRPWRTTAQGKALMIKALGNMLVIDMVLAYTLFGEYPGRDPVRLVGFTLFLIGIWSLLISLLTTPGARDYPPFSWFRRDRNAR